MSFFGGRSAASPASSPAAGTSSDQTARKLEVMQQVRQELASAHLQELVNKMTERCYEVCLPQGRDGLSSKDQACLANCSGARGCFPRISSTQWNTAPTQNVLFVLPPQIAFSKHVSAACHARCAALSEDMAPSEWETDTHRLACASVNVVSNTYVQRLNKERQQSAGGPNALSGELLS